MEVGGSQVPVVLRKLLRHYGLTQGGAAVMMGKSTSWMQERVSGRTACSHVDLAGLSRLLGVPVDLFYRDPNEAVRYAIDHPSDLLIPYLAWVTGSPGTQLGLFDTMPAVAVPLTRSGLDLTRPSDSLLAA